MATPHVTGVAALVLITSVTDAGYDANNNGYWDPAEVRQKLRDTETDLGATGKDIYFGYGLVNALAATKPTTTPTPSPVKDEMHIASIEMSKRIVGINTNAIATVTVVDANGPIEGATVTGYWDNLTHDNDAGITDALGIVTLISDRVKRADGTFTFTVNTVEHIDFNYNASANVEYYDSITAP